jgi:hypothetical protein
LTERVLQVELVVSGISDALREFLAAKSASHRVSEAGHHFIAGDIDEANVLIKAVHSGGGSLIECTPVRESLEDYFMREQWQIPRPRVSFAACIDRDGRCQYLLRGYAGWKR